MADADTIRILEEGVEAWNKWRLENPDISIDLVDAELIEANLQGINLRRANLQGAVLRQADLTGADLTHANLQFANFEEARLPDAIFTEASLAKVNLRHALLRGANFGDADLSTASIAGADLSYSDLRNVSLFNSDLSGTNLLRANLRGADLRGARLRNAQIAGIIYDRDVKVLGVDTTGATGNDDFILFVHGKSQHEEIRRKGPVIYFLWLMRRSFPLWILLCLLVVGIFAELYYRQGENAFIFEQGLKDTLGFSRFTTFYYSVVTFSTLGFGDITPTQLGAASLVMVEVFVGYIMLGVLVSIITRALRTDQL